MKITCYVLISPLSLNKTPNSFGRRLAGSSTKISTPTYFVWLPWIRSKKWLISSSTCDYMIVNAASLSCLNLR